MTDIVLNACINLYYIYFIILIINTIYDLRIFVYNNIYNII